MAKFAINASGTMLLPSLVQVSESISGSVVPLAMFQFSCHVCFQVSDTPYLIAMSDEYFDVQKSKASNCRGTFLTFWVPKKCSQN